MYYNSSETPPCPAVRIKITGMTKVGKAIYPLNCEPFDALIDTGADVTCLPESAIKSSPVVYERRPVSYGDGPEQVGKFLYLSKATIEFLNAADLVIFTGQYNDLLLHVLDDGLLGRDILNNHHCRLDGPKLVCLIS
jgi:hypothetical protein